MVYGTPEHVHCPDSCQNLPRGEEEAMNPEFIMKLRRKYLHSCYCVRKFRTEHFTAMILGIIFILTSVISFILYNA
jgi:hypothetical protein